MTEHMASRTLVKSPPELWAECSDASSLARHLDQFGEIKITRLDPENTVAWEGERARGTVRIEPAGWGTKVILTAVPMEEAQGKGPAEEVSESAEPESVEPAVVEPEAVGSETVGFETVGPEVLEPAIEDPPAAVELPEIREPALEGPQIVERQPGMPRPRRRRFARLFWFRREPPSVAAEPEKAVEQQPPIDPEPVPRSDAEPIPEPEPTPEPIPEPTPEAVSEPIPEAIPEPTREAIPEPTPEAISEPTSYETAPEATEAALTAALDSLGQAHHRPYSRA